MSRKKRKYQRAPDTAALRNLEAQGAGAFSETVGAELARTLDKRMPLKDKLDAAYNKGHDEAWKNAKASYDGRLQQDKRELKDSLLMTFQRLGDANAQMAMQFVKLLERV